MLQAIARHPAPYFIIAAIAFVLWYESRRKPATKAASSDVPVAAPGTPDGIAIGDATRPNWLPGSSPELHFDPDGIPSDVFDATIEQVGSALNKQLLYSARLCDNDNSYMQSIPEEVVLLPDDSRTMWADDPRLPGGSAP